MSVELLGNEDNSHESLNGAASPEGKQDVARGAQDSLSMTFAEALELYRSEVIAQIAALHISLR